MQPQQVDELGALKDVASVGAHLTKHLSLVGAIARQFCGAHKFRG